ncbi:MAG: alpha/beta hydrolase [Cyanobacteria bacterium J06629_18]
MLCIINRTLNEGISPPAFLLPREVTFHPSDSQAQQQVYFCNWDIPSNKVTEIGSEVFFDEMISSAYEEVLFYIHGTLTPPEGGLDTAKRFQELFDQEFPESVEVIPWLWATHPDGNPLEKYFDDKVTAEASGIAFARALLLLEDYKKKFLQDHPQSWLKKVNIFAYSMGNRVFRATVRDLRNIFDIDEIPFLFKQVFLCAADIPNESLHVDDNRGGQLIPYTCDWVICYYARDDIPLIASGVINGLKSRMLGLTGVEDISQTLDNVFQADCSSFNGDFDLTGHGYFLSKDGDISPVFYHVFQAIANNNVPTGNQDVGDGNIVLPLLSTSRFQVNKIS